MKIHDCLHYLHIFCNNFYSYNYGSAVSSWIKAFCHPHFSSGLKNNVTSVSNFKMSTFWSGDLGFGCATHFYPWWLRKMVLPKKCKSFYREFNFLFPSLAWVAWGLTSPIHLVKCPFSYCKFYNLLFNSISSLEIRNLSLLNFHMMLDILLGICMFCIFYCEYFLFCAACYMSFLSIHAMSSIKTVAQGN